MIIGILIGIVFGVGIGIALPIIKSHLKRPEKVELSKKELIEKEEQKEKQKRIKKSFDELMNYDYNTALGGGISE